MQHQDSCLNKGSGAGQTTAAGRWGPNVSGGQPAQTCAERPPCRALPCRAHTCPHTLRPAPATC